MPITAMSSPLANCARRPQILTSRAATKAPLAQCHTSAKSGHLVHTQTSSHAPSTTASATTTTAPTRTSIPVATPGFNRNVVSIPAERLVLPAAQWPSSSHESSSSAQHPTQSSGHSAQSTPSHTSIAQEMVLHAAGATLQGYAPGYKFENQDSALVLSTFMTTDQALFAVMDGHGSHGARVSQFVRAALPNALIENLAGGASPAAALHHAFVGVEARMSTQAQMDPTALDINSSGSTAIVCHMGPGNVLTTAWVGDSRAVLGRRRPTGSPLASPSMSASGSRISAGDLMNDSSSPVFISSGWDAVALSDDHKPERPDEKLRITSLGGRVQQKSGRAGHPTGPTRVWLAERDFPGLAMSRAFGDAPVKAIGITSEPQKSVVTLSPPPLTGVDEGMPQVVMLADGPGHAAASWPVGSPFAASTAGAGVTLGSSRSRSTQQQQPQPHHVLLLASDGVWDVISNQEAVDLVVAAELESSSSNSRGAVRVVTGSNKRAQALAEDGQRMASVGAVRLVEEAHRRWVTMYGGGYIDDISAVVVVMDGGCSQ
ncbi:MAG: hypothetical protein WDW38_004906 [Sanguina aurantia]